MTENSQGLRFELRTRLQQKLKQRYFVAGLGIVMSASAGTFMFLNREAPAEITEKKTIRHEAPPKTDAIMALHAIAEVNDNIPSLSWMGDYPQGTMFQIERSVDGVDFEVLQKAPKEEVWNKNGEFRFQDAESVGGTVYYRISCLDENNAIITSDIVTVTLSAGEKQQLEITSVEPVPFNDYFTLNIAAAKEEIVSFEIMSHNGSQVYSEVYVVKPGENIIGFTRGTLLSPGVYIVRVSGSDNAVAMTKMVRH